MKRWIFSPHLGGKTIPLAAQERIKKRVFDHASRRDDRSFDRLEVSFRGKFCYIDVFQEPVNPTEAVLTLLGETKEHYLERLGSTPTHLCRLRYFSEDKWSLALYLYSHERYEPNVFATGEFFGTPEEALDLCATFCVP
jgi:hypothetical protein